MKLSPNTAIVAAEKLRDYLLNFENPDGESKARFLAEIGYERGDWRRLENDLRDQHLTKDCVLGRKSIYGQKYEIVAPLVGPNGGERWIRSVWIVRRNETQARLVTLIPEKPL